MSDTRESVADFKEDLEFGKLGEDLFIRILNNNKVKFDDLRDDAAARAVDVDFRLYFPVLGPVLVDVKTHTSWDRIPIEIYSDIANKIRGCDYTSHARYFVHFFLLTQTVLVVDRQRFVDYMEGTEEWKKIVPYTFPSVHGKNTWECECKQLPLSMIPGYSGGRKCAPYPNDWWCKFKFDLTDELLAKFWTFEKFRKNAWNYENELKDSFNFKQDNVIRCPFCLEKGRPGNMIVTTNSLDGGLFFSCPTCYAERKTGKKVISSFDLDGWKRNNTTHAKLAYQATYPLFILKSLAESNNIGIVEC